MNDPKPTRRAVLAGLSALSAAFVSVPRGAFALTESQAIALVEALVGEIQSTINSGRSETAVLRDFERLFERYADVPTIARFALGAPARSASAAELRGYTDAFKVYIARKYGQRFQDFIGGSVTVRRARPDRNGIVVVETVAELRGQSPFAVDFHVSDRSGSPRMFNVIIEGVNMLTTERTEMGALYDQSGRSISRLTSRLSQA